MAKTDRRILAAAVSTLRGGKHRKNPVSANKSTDLRLDKLKPESLVVVRHLCFINYEDDVAIVDIVLCDESIALAPRTLNEDVGIEIVSIFRPRSDQDRWNIVLFIIFIKELRECRLSRRGCALTRTTCSSSSMRASSWTVSVRGHRNGSST